MPPRGVCDTRCQTFWTSVIKNEEAMRNKWFLKNQDLILANLSLQEQRLLQSFKDDSKLETEKLIKKSLEKKKKDAKIKALKPKKVKSKKDETDVSFMKPIDSKVKNILYESGVESFAAANNYLHERYKMKPEDRYFNRECSSWEYGWSLNDSPPISPSEVGIRSIIATSFYSRDASSLKRDPDWYRMYQTKNSKNFNELLTY